jgi:hypothetical protein
MKEARHDRMLKKVDALNDALAHLSSDDDLRELIKIIRKPGWTTPAETIFVHGVLDSLIAHANAMAGLKKQLLAGSRAVELKQ